MPGQKVVKKVEEKPAPFLPLFPTRIRVPGYCGIRVSSGHRVFALRRPAINFRHFPEAHRGVGV